MKQDESNSVQTEKPENCTGREYSFTAKPLPGEGIKELFNRLAVLLKHTDTSLASLMIFGSISARPAVEEVTRRNFGPINWPVTWVEGIPYDNRPIAGMQAVAIRAGHAHPVILKGRVVGSVFEDGAIRHCVLGGLEPAKVTASPVVQFQQTLGDLETALGQNGFALGDVIRTWFYNDDLLAWYGDFNEARTRAYSRVNFRGGSSPASTAVSGRNPAGAALVVAARAVQPLDSEVSVNDIASPMQCPAPAYGSTFSRAIEISTRQDRRLLISGTASIASEGATLWPGNTRRQIEQTMEVVESILKSRGLEFSDINRAIAYFKNRNDIPEIAAWCASRGLHPLPIVSTQCGICRDDLLFELEADAFKRLPISSP